MSMLLRVKAVCVLDEKELIKNQKTLSGLCHANRKAAKQEQYITTV